MSKFAEFRQEFIDKVKALRKVCPHTETLWHVELVGFHWTHSSPTGNRIQMCENCRKIVAREPVDLPEDLGTFDKRLEELDWNEGQKVGVYLDDGQWKEFDE